MRYPPIVLWLLTAAVGGLVGGLVSAAVIGLDPAPFRTVVKADDSGEKPCYRVDLTGKVIGRC